MCVGVSHLFSCPYSAINNLYHLRQVILYLQNEEVETKAQCKEIIHTLKAYLYSDILNSILFNFLKINANRDPLSKPCWVTVLP